MNFGIDLSKIDFKLLSEKIHFKTALSKMHFKSSSGQSKVTYHCCCLIETNITHNYLACQIYMILLIHDINNINQNT